MFNNVNTKSFAISNNLKLCFKPLLAHAAQHLRRLRKPLCMVGWYPIAYQYLLLDMLDIWHCQLGQRFEVGIGSIETVQMTPQLYHGTAY